MKRRIGIALATAVALMGVLLLSLCVVLATQTGSRWLLGWVPGLEIEAFQGSLLRQWQADRLQWTDGEGTQVDAQNVHFVLKPRCLFSLRLCVQQLSVNVLTLTVPESEASETEEPVILPEIELPLSIMLSHAHLGEFVLNGESLLKEFSAQIELTGDRLNIRSLAVHYDPYALQAQGSLTLRQQWPLELQLTASGTVDELGEQEVRINASGSVAELQLMGQLQGTLTGTLQAQMQPLAVAIPAELKLELSSLQLQALLPEFMAVQQLSASLRGDLQQGYAAQYATQLTSHAQPLILQGSGRLTEQDFSELQASLLQSEHELAQLNGYFDWADTFRAHAQLQLHAADWNTLVGLSDIDASLERLQAQANYTAEGYQANMEAELQGPLGAMQMQLSVQGDEQQAELTEFKLHAGAGSLQGSAKVEFSQGIAWQAAVQAHEINPAWWVEELPGTLAGHIDSQGHWHDERLQLNAQIDMQGSLNQQPTNLKATLAADQDAWMLSGLDVSVGENKLTGKVRIEQQLEGWLKLQAPRLAQAWPDLTGAAQLDMQLAGTAQRPSAQLQGNAQRVAYAGHRFQDLSLNASLNAQQHATLVLEIQALELSEQPVGHVSLKGAGNRAEQQLMLEVQGDVAVKARVQGRLEQELEQWLGALQSFELSALEQQWRLEQPMSIDYGYGQDRLRTGAHCFLGVQASLCAGAQQWLPQLQIDYRLNNLPLAGLKPWLPEGVRLDALLNGEIHVQQHTEGLDGRVRLDAGHGKLRYLDEDEEETFAWRVLRLEADLGAQKINTRLELQGQETGQLLLRIALEPQSAEKSIVGDFLLQQLDLQPLQALLPQIDEIAGLVEGQGKISGSLLQPDIRGAVRLRDGRFTGGLLPLDIEALTVDVQIHNTQARISGGWRSGEAGQAELKGTLSWDNALLLDATLKGSGLPLHVEPYADLLVEPDLQLSLDEHRLAISGRIAVPRGEITVPQLPEQAVRLSPDAQVIGRKEQQASMPITLDVEIVVGEERLTFAGLGLTAEVLGRLQLSDNLVGRGVLELKNGRYRAYGQRLQLRRARLVFSGPITQPYIDIEAVRVTGDVTAGVRLLGPAEQPQTEIFSQPPMSQEQALSWLLLGRPLTGAGDSDSNVLSQAALALGMIGAAPVAEKLADFLGIKEFQVDTEGSGLTSSIMASGRITDKLVLSYGVGVFQTSNIIQLRYELTRRLYLEAASGLSNSLDIFYRRSF